jgi:hypothetical protein
MYRAVIFLCAISIPSLLAADSGTGGIYVETGLEAGGAIGVESRTFSTWRAVLEIGYMREYIEELTGKGWGLGGTLYGGLGVEDMRIGLTPRVRYRFGPDWSVDVSAGVIFATLENEPGVSDTGFVGGLHLNYGRWLTFRADVNVKKVDDRVTYQFNEPVLHEGGYETAVYGGLAVRGTAGWTAAAIGGAVFLAFMWWVVASGGAS